MFAGKIFRALSLDDYEAEEHPTNTAEVADAKYKAGKITG